VLRRFSSFDTALVIKPLFLFNVVISSRSTDFKDESE